MVIKRYSALFFRGLTVPFVFLLAGCPGKGDQLQLDETTQVKLVSDSICFRITNPQDYPACNYIDKSQRDAPEETRVY